MLTLYNELTFVVKVSSKYQPSNTKPSFVDTGNVPISIPEIIVLDSTTLPPFVSKVTVALLKFDVKVTKSSTFSVREIAISPKPHTVSPFLALTYNDKLPFETVILNESPLVFGIDKYLSSKVPEI